jgi:hypothetical protein
LKELNIKYVFVFGTECLKGGRLTIWQIQVNQLLELDRINRNSASAEERARAGVF